MTHLAFSALDKPVRINVPNPNQIYEQTRESLSVALAAQGLPSKDPYLLGIGGCSGLADPVPLKFPGEILTPLGWCLLLNPSPRVPVRA